MIEKEIDWNELERILSVGKQKIRKAMDTLLVGLQGRLNKNIDFKDKFQNIKDKSCNN